MFDFGFQQARQPSHFPGHTKPLPAVAPLGTKIALRNIEAFGIEFHLPQIDRMTDRFFGMRGVQCITASHTAGYIDFV